MAVMNLKAKSAPLALKMSLAVSVHLNRFMFKTPTWIWQKLLMPVILLDFSTMAVCCKVSWSLPGSREGPNHKNLLYAVLPYIYARDCWKCMGVKIHGCNQQLVGRNHCD